MAWEQGLSSAQEGEGRRGEGRGGEGKRDILRMGAVHDDEAVHQFRVPLDHTPEERESEVLGSTSGLDESAVMVAYSFHTIPTNNRRLWCFNNGFVQ